MEPLLFAKTFKIVYFITVLKNIETEFKKASVYYSYERAGTIFNIVYLICALIVIISFVWAYISDTPLIAQIATLVAILVVIASVLISDKFKPKEKEYYVWLKFLKFEKRNGYGKDKPKLREILANNGIITTEKLQEVVAFYRDKNQSVVTNSSGNFFAILALCSTSIFFIFSVHDGFTDGRFILVMLFVVVPLMFYPMFLILKKRLNVYHDFYKILEELLTEILIEDLAKVVEKPKRIARKTKPKKQTQTPTDK